MNLPTTSTALAKAKDAFNRSCNIGNTAATDERRRAVHLLWEAYQGIVAVDRGGLVHRDLKPENLFVTQRATGEDWCKVLDFGFAKGDLSRMTNDGAVIGTVRYTAPEQLRDGATAGACADIYALGAVLYECLCGAAPFSATTPQELMFKVLNEEPKPLDRVCPHLPRDLAQLVHRALAKVPEQRFASVEQFARALMPFSQVGSDQRSRAVTVSSEGLPAEAAIVTRRHGSIALALGVVSLILGGTFLLGGSAEGASKRIPSPPPWRRVRLGHRSR